MLVHLSIQNYALIDHLELDWEAGLTTITGETGSGKSIVLGALSLILGKRAEPTALRNPTTKCILEATFDLSGLPLKGLFEQNDWDWDDKTQLRREILPSGKSRAFVNDTPASLQRVQELSIHLIDIHSQHQSLDLFSKEYQRQVLDIYAGNQQGLEEYRKDYFSYRQKQKELEHKRSEQLNLLQEEDYKSFLLNELEAADLDQAQPKSWEEEYELLSKQEHIAEVLSGVQQTLQLEHTGVLDQLSEWKARLQEFAALGQNYQDLANRFESAFIELDDLAQEAEIRLRELEADPGRQQWLSEKLQLLLDLQRKHLADSVEELISKREQYSAELSNTADLDEHIKILEQELEELEARLRVQAAELHKNRKTAVDPMLLKFGQELSDLGMPAAQFEVLFHPKDSFTSSGNEEVEWLFSANKGADFAPLKKVASGGELSRIMLVVKAMLAEHQQLPTLIFDEIDTGVSGEIANQMGRIMEQMSAHMQLIAITHLPQVAAKGNKHFKVFKEERSGETYTGVHPLNNQERLEELASMISGAERSETAIRHAQELLGQQTGEHQ